MLAKIEKSIANSWKKAENLITSLKIPCIFVQSFHFNGELFRYYASQKNEEEEEEVRLKEKKINMEHPKIDVDRRSESLLCVIFRLER